MIKNLKVFGAVFVLSVSSYHVCDKIVGTADFQYAIEREQNIDDLKDYVLQGLCKVDDKYLLSAYDYKHTDKSVLYILDEDLERYSIKELDTYSHVGGITYDPKNEIVWVTDTDGVIVAYDKNEILSYRPLINSNCKRVYVGAGLENIFGECSAAYITYHDDKLYVGNFNTKGNTIIKEYEIKDDGMINPFLYRTFNAAGFIQGITFYEDGDKNYLIVSSSFGKQFDSTLQIYDFDTLEIIRSIKTNEMMEEIIVDDNELITIYESNAKIYKRHKKGTDIITLDINKILTKS